MATAFQEYVECPICMNLLQPPDHEPLILACLHTVCGHCFDKIRSDSHIQCPLCNAVCDNTYVKKDFRTASLVEAFLKASNRHSGGRLSASQICGICEEVKVIECKCLQCDKMLCMSCVRGHKAIKELAAHPLASISDIAQKTLEQLSSARTRLELLLGRYAEQSAQLYQQAAILEQTETEAVVRLNNIEDTILRQVQGHFDSLRKEVQRGKEHLLLELENTKQHVITDKRDVGNQFNHVSTTMTEDAFSIFSTGAEVLNGAIQVAEAKEVCVPELKSLAYNVDVVDGLRFDPTMSACVRMTAEIMDSRAPQLEPRQQAPPQHHEPTSYSVPMWSDPLNSTRQELYDQLNLFDVLRGTVPVPVENTPNPSWSEVVQDQSKALPPPVAKPTPPPQQQQQPNPIQPPIQQPPVMNGQVLVVGAAPSLPQQQQPHHPQQQQQQQQQPAAPDPVVTSAGQLPVRVDDWHVVGNKSLPGPTPDSSEPGDTSEHYTKTKYVAVRRTAYRLHLYGNELWCTTDNALHVFSLDCERVRTVQLQGVGYARAVVRTSTGKLLVADCDKEDMKYEDGLKLLDANGHFLKILMHKKTCDVTVYKGKAYAVKHKQPAVYVFRDAGNDSWIQENKIQLLGYYKGLGMHTICVAQDMIYLCPKNCQSVYVYTLAGRITGCYGKKGWNLQVGLDLSVENSTAGSLCDARICGEDSRGNVLLADSTNQRLQVLKEGGHWSEVTLEKNSGVWDAVAAQGGQVIWVIEGRNNVAKYKKLVKR